MTTSRFSRDERDFRSKSQRLLAAVRRRDARPSVPTLEEFRAWLEEEKRGTGFWECVYCGRLLDISGVSIDHKIPLSRTGLSSFDNLAICCEPCNRTKGDLLESEYRQLTGMLSVWSKESRESVKRRLRQKPSYRR